MAKFKKGDAVRQIMAEPMAGVVAEYAVDQTTGDVQTRVEWTDAEGHVHSRFFREEHLEAAPDAEAAPSKPGFKR